MLLILAEVVRLAEAARREVASEWPTPCFRPGLIGSQSDWVQVLSTPTENGSLGGGELEEQVHLFGC